MADFINTYDSIGNREGQLGLI